MSSILNFLHDMNISSMLAVLILICFLYDTYKYRHEFFTEDKMGPFFAGYALMFGAYVSLFMYNCFHVTSEFQFITAAGASTFTGIIIAGLIEVFQSLNDEAILDYLWRRFSHKRPQVVMWMFIILSAPFTLIFFMQSEWIFGFYWFYGLIVIAYMVHLIISGLSQAFDALIDWATCRFNTEE